MMMKMKLDARWIVAAAVSLFAVPVWAHCGHCGVGGTEAGHAHGDATAHAEIGKPAPDFTLTDVDGKKHSLADLKGKVVILEWLNHECPVTNKYCTNGAMKSTLAKFAGKPVQWFGIDSSHFCAEKVDSIRKWAQANKVSYPLLLDAPGTVGHAYQAKTTPHMFVIDQKGILAYMGAPDDDPYGNKDKKRNYVEEAVTALLNGSTVAKTVTKSFGCSVKYKK